MSHFHVAIVGAGLGGLALAQALKRRAIAFDVFESDPALDSRPQGYRLRIDAQGQAALAQALTPGRYALFRHTASISATSGRFLAPDLTPSSRRVPDSWHSDAVAGNSDPVAEDLSINRRTLREILMCGIEAHVHFGRGLDHYRLTQDGRMDLDFGPDVAAASCDILVGADGVNSRVRAQLVPTAAPVETGDICFYGKTDLERLDPTQAGLEGTRIIFADGFAAILDPMQFDHARWQNGCNCPLTPINDYLYWCLIGPENRFGMTPGQRMDAAGIRKLTLSATKDWHPSLQQILLQSEPADTAMLPIRSGCPGVIWPAGPVTLLGDAIHVMTPAGGLGANTALVDAVALASAISSVANRPHETVPALEHYALAMRQRAAMAQAASNHGAARLFQAMAAGQH